ncbi:MAG: DUF4175 family protein [Bacteroidales bacterium]|nr:DUF4175 family protein [Bacteroidales bacterium]
MGKEGLIIEKLDNFIRKYYKNKLIRGMLYSAATLLSLFIAVVALERFGYFSTGVRTFLFWFYIVVGCVLLGTSVVSPLLKMRGLGKRIDNEAAARIIGQHFPEVKDRLLNLLQLEERSAAPTGQQTELLRAAIDQKAEQLRPVPFANAIDLKANRKYVKYVAMPALAIVVALVVAPSFVTAPSRRLIDHNTAYERPAPFSFTVLNDSLQAVRGEDFSLEVETKGEALPEETYVVVGGHNYRMQRKDKTHFTYLFKNLRETTLFQLQAAGFWSKGYELKVFPNPMVTNFSVTMHYPSYTGKQDEEVSNMGDMAVPEGTVVEWHFQTNSVDALHFLKEESEDPFGRRADMALVPDKNGRISFSLRIMRSMQYGFCTSNKHVISGDTLRYSISAISDAAPMISATEMMDSLAPERIFFKGRIKDDYGFSKLVFRMEVTHPKDTAQNRSIIQILPLEKEASQEFYFSTHLTEMNLQPGDKATYYFQVWDNDAINGPKSAVSQKFEFKVPTGEELDDILRGNMEQIEDKAENSINELKRLQKDMGDLMQRLMDKKDLNWNDKQQMQQLAEKQREVRRNLEQMWQQMKENKRLEERYRQQSEEIMQKQAELDKLMEKTFTDEMKKMMDELDKLMQQVDKNKVQEQLESMQIKNEDLSKRLDQNIELMKRLELEKKVEEAIGKVDELAKKQDQLAEETRKDKTSREELQKKQQDLSADFQGLKRRLEEIQQGYKKLDNPEDFKLDKNLEQGVEQSQQEAQQQLQKGNNNKAAERQKQASEHLKQLSEQLRQEQQQIEQQSLAEDSEQIRRLLKSLVQLSFNQEDLLRDAKRVFIQDPRYQTIIAEQNKIKTDFRNVNDSLEAIAKRQIAVASLMDKELASANDRMVRTLDDLLRLNQSFYGHNRNVQAASSMQYAMTSLNNLSLILAESLDQMQDQMRQQRNGNQQQKSPGMKMKGQCNKPGNAKPSPKSMKEMQDALNKQMESLRKQLEKQGDKPARTKIGEKNGLSEDFARMAAEQEQIRRMMQQYGQEMKESQPGNAEMAKEIEQMMQQMEQTEADLVNRTITNQTMRRQQQIMTRLLEHENADLKQQKEQRRQSKEAQDMPQPSQGDIEMQEKLRKKNLELFRSAPPSLTPYYKEKVDGYFFRFKK